MGNNLIKWDGVEKFSRCSEGNQMLGRWILSFALVLAAGSAQASTWAESMFNELNKDFGSVPRGPTLVHHFRVKNNTSETVHISGVRVSCGCVSASVLKSQISPNEETSVIAHMDSTRFNGSKSVTVYVTFDKPKFEEVRLLVQAYGRNDFAVSPENFNFNEIRRGKSAESKITLRFYGFPNLEVVDVKTESHYLKVQYDLVKREGNDVIYEATAIVREDIPVGKWFSDIFFKTNVGSIPMVRVPLNVQVESMLTVSPANLSLGTVKMGDTSDRKIVVRGTQPFTILGLEGLDENWVVKDLSKEKKEVHVITLSFKANREGDLKHKVLIKTDIPESGNVELNANAFVNR
jgi:hypothetical protein